MIEIPPIYMTTDVGNRYIAINNGNGSVRVRSIDEVQVIDIGRHYIHLEN
jgi:hypothetical protein